MRSSCLFGLSSLVLASALVTTTAAAQQPGPPPGYEPPPPGYQQPPPGYQQPPPGYQQPPPSQPYYYQPPPPAPYPYPPPRPPEPPTHAPKYSLWVGPRLSFIGFGFSFYDNEHEEPETTGNFLGNGFGTEIDVGARISYHYIPYLFWDHGFMGQGHRFAGTDAHSSTDFYGIGFRYSSGDVDEVAFVTDLSIGERVVSVSEGSQSYSMSGIEFFRLGLGAEIRLATLFSISPLVSISSGSLNDSKGNVTFACGPNNGACGDGVTNPRYTNGAVINESRAYVVLSAGLGIHFDVFGK